MDAVTGLRREMPRLVLLLLALPALCAAADISGDWELTAYRFGDETYARVSFKLEGEKLTGTAFGLKLEGTLRGDAVEFTAKRADNEPFRVFHGVLKGGELSGDAVWFGTQKLTWTARRSAVRPPSPSVHDFEPTKFHRQFSGAIPPVMHISP